MNRVGLIYNPEVPAAVSLAEKVGKMLQNMGWVTWSDSAWHEDRLREEISSLSAVVTFGGDGTILRVARVAAPARVPIVGVNLGRVGFLTELMPEDVQGKLPDLLRAQQWVDARVMLSARIWQPFEDLPAGVDCRDLPPEQYTVSDFIGLNDVVVGRGEMCRTVQLDTTIDDSFLTCYRGDGLVVATPTGSTAYSLAAGGPVLYPQLDNLVLTPLLTHLKLSPPMVLPGSSEIVVRVFSDHSTIFSVDGQEHVNLRNGAVVLVALSTHKAQFLRGQAPTYFFKTLAQRLNW